MDLQSLFYIVAIIWMSLMTAVTIMIAVIAYKTGKHTNEFIASTKEHVDEIHRVVMSGLVKKASTMALVTPVISSVAKSFFESRKK